LTLPPNLLIADYPPGGDGQRGGEHDRALHDEGYRNRSGPPAELEARDGV
jgi:hypothetical protein